MLNTDDNAITAEWLVDALLTRHPEAASVFVANRMACVGCAISGFHTLAEVAAIYNIDIGTLLQKLERVISSRSSVSDTGLHE